MFNRFPSIQVEIDNVPLAADLRDLRIHQRLGLPALCEITFSTITAAVRAININQPLRVLTQAAGECLFSGLTTAVEYMYPPGGAPALRVRGYDLLHKLRERQHVRAFAQINLSRLLQELSGDVDPEAELLGENLALPLLIQHQQNDLEFLAEQAAQAGTYPLARGERLYLVPLSGFPERPEILLEYGRNLTEAQVEVNRTGDISAISVRGWETAHSSMNGARAVKGDGREIIDMPVHGLPDHHEDPDEPDHVLVNLGLEDLHHASALARAELERLKAGRIVLRGRAQGSQNLQPGVPVQVSGLADDICGRYILTHVTHLYDHRQHYTVELSSEPPQVPARSRCDVITMGIVTNVDDPEHIGRVRARLPGYEFHNQIETGWMPVVCPGAGPGKGLTSLPDPGDRVLVILAREDPARGIVLGGLYAPGSNPPDGTADHAGRYAWATRAGQHIRLDQDGHVILLENGAGARIELRGNEIVIQAGQINFRRSFGL